MTGSSHCGARNDLKAPRPVGNNRRSVMLRVPRSNIDAYSQTVANCIIVAMACARRGSVSSFSVTTKFEGELTNSEAEFCSISAARLAYIQLYVTTIVVKHTKYSKTVKEQQMLPEQHLCHHSVRTTFTTVFHVTPSVSSCDPILTLALRSTVVLDLGIREREPSACFGV